MIDIHLDPVCNPSWYGLITNQNTTVTSETTGNGSVGVSSIVALVIFFGLIIYSAYVVNSLFTICSVSFVSFFSLTSSTKSSSGKLLGISGNEETGSAIPQSGTS